MKRFGMCRTHGDDVELLVICKHLMETNNIKYVNIGNGVILCEDCLVNKPEDLNSMYGSTICIKCFEELKSQNNLSEVIKH